MSPRMRASSDFVLPQIEALLIPEAVDFNLRHNPDQIFFIYSEHEGSDEPTIITHLEFGRAAHRVARTLRPDHAGPEQQVVAFIALADTILYQAIIAGLITAGLVPFPISPRNSPAAVVNLLQKTSCHRLITTQVTLRPLIGGIQAHISSIDSQYQLLIEEIPSLADIYPKLGHETANDPFQPYPAPPSRPLLNDVCAYLHSSGSTGFPKPIPQTHLAFSHWALSPPVIDFRDRLPHLPMGCMALPSFHTLGIYMQFLNPIYGIVPIAVYPPTATSRELVPITPSPDNVIDHMHRTHANSLIVVPSLLHTWAQSSDAIKFLATLDFVLYSGGSLPQKLGDKLVRAGIALHTVYGGTEFAVVSHMLTLKGDEKDWQYACFSERAKTRWVAQGDGTFELQILTWEKHYPMVENLPDVRGYATSDLWERHPTKEHLWKIVGRVDDVIVHSSGEKTVPAPMEDVIMCSPLVQRVIMFGRERDHAGILIEFKSNYAIDVNDDRQVAEMRNKLWPIIEEANNNAPAFSRIYKEMILFASKDKPLATTGKGTVMRKATLNMYGGEINALYEAVEISTKSSATVKLPATWSLGDIEDWLLQQVKDLYPGKEISISREDLFDQGFDSLGATFLRHRIAGVLRSSKDVAIQNAAGSLAQNTVYSHPTIKKLAALITGLIAGINGSPLPADWKALVEGMIEKYSLGFGLVTTSLSQPVGAPLVVLLTGSTGNLGSHILASLIQEDRVRKIYAFNRTSSGTRTILQRHKIRFEDTGLDVTSLESSKLAFVSGDSAEPTLGLDQTTYAELRSSVNLIVHNAWKLDFNQSLSSFEPLVRGTRHLIDLALSGPNSSSTRFLFTSSVASAQSWDQVRGPYLEEMLMDASFALGGGYGEGKYVAERILQKSGLQSTSLRIGQISGGLPNGAWATSDWLPILVKSSMTLGALPKAEGVVSWLPMDAVSKAIVDVALADGTHVALNLVHPRPLEWNMIITYIRKALINQSNMKSDQLGLLPFDDWFSRLELRSNDTNEDVLDKVPAIKLLDFFRALSLADAAALKHETRDGESGGLARFSTTKMQGLSSTVRDIPQLLADDADRWVRYWIGVGFL